MNELGNRIEGRMVLDTSRYIRGMGVVDESGLGLCQELQRESAELHPGDHFAPDLAGHGVHLSHHSSPTSLNDIAKKHA